MSEVALIINPVAGAGRAQRRAPGVEAALRAGGDLRVFTTVAAGDEATQVQRALDAGARTIAVLGGDGSWSQSAAALFRSGADARLALFAGGTGNDLVKTLGVPAHDAGAMAALSRRPDATRTIDLVEIDGQISVNVAGFGFDVAVLARTLREGKRAGVFAYLDAALRELRDFAGIQSIIDGRGTPQPTYFMIVIANAQRFGGVFHIAPNAQPDDGLVDLITIGRIPGLRRRIPLLLRALRGTHVRDAELRISRHAAFAMHFREPPLFEVDGELRQARDRRVEVAVHRHALRVVAAPR